MQKIIRNTNLHSQTVQGIIDKFYEAIASWREAKKSNPNARIPKRRKWYFVIPYKASAIRLKNGRLLLSNGKNNEPISLEWPYSLPKIISVSFDCGYRVNAAYAESPEEAPAGDDTAGIDLGEIHIAVTATGKRVIISNGRELRAKRRRQNKVKAHFQRRMDKCKKRSRKWKQLDKVKKRTLKRLNNQIKDVLHKQTTAIVRTMKTDGVRTVGIGDLRELRQDVDYGAHANQRIHQMTFGQARQMITYKAKRAGMVVELINEAYTSQTCPKCGARHKSVNRDYQCPVCGLAYHRDGVGAVNIRQKTMYRELVPVVGDMIPPVGVRYSA
jgi:putative transposase